jgi:microcystin-dependent protein
MVTLSEAQMPNHNHTAFVTEEDGRDNDPSNTQYVGAGDQMWGPSNNLVAMSEKTLPTAGGSQAHNNMQPFMAINFIIALVGLYPSRS